MGDMNGDEIDISPKRRCCGDGWWCFLSCTRCCRGCWWCFIPCTHCCRCCKRCCRKGDRELDEMSWNIVDEFAHHKAQLVDFVINIRAPNEDCVVMTWQQREIICNNLGQTLIVTEAFDSTICTWTLGVQALPGIRDQWMNQALNGHVSDALGEGWFIASVQTKDGSTSHRDFNDGASCYEDFK